MNQIISQLSIIFDPPFYKAIFEREFNAHYEVAQVVLGTTQSKTPLILKLINEKRPTIHFYAATSDLGSQLAVSRHINPKRRQRLARKAVLHQGIGTKAQSALKAQFEQSKRSRKHHHTQERTVVNQQRYLAKQIKRIEKHKGH
ncbi:hypothetical protein YK48G_17120 [Lentilactobacillus fungorum]|uniref:DUF2992 domain-containing protein n=1 Tax=Lentilactobacillus fungorum TaxID=2201250 RepID=A0ABQ3VZE5_9LACO|nr:YjdF family protein [Lentilactobacillus fungorum]GHP14287.1 hypothetical protein YK48G_17120 [Lentilactobacillus fungorum]